MLHKDIHYTKGKIINALSVLALNEGDLRSRVREAAAIVMSASYFEGYETEAQTISGIMKKVVAGDWTGVSDAEVKQVAVAIWRMSERLS